MLIESLVRNLQADIALLQRYMERRAGIGFNEMSPILEAMTIPLFRAWKGCELEDMNQIKVNYPAIDLADEKTAVQVTSNATPGKVTKTITAYEAKDLHQKYEHLYILGFSKASHPANLPAYCTVVGIDPIVRDLLFRANEEDVEQVLNAVQRHAQYSSLHPWSDRDCLEIVLNYVDRNAVKHSMGVEGSATLMVQGLNEISELIGKGQVNRKAKSKSLDEFSDAGIKAYLRTVKDLISDITAIVHGARVDGHDFVYLDHAQSEAIDSLKTKIAELSNQIARNYGIPIDISLKRGWT